MTVLTSDLLWGCVGFLMGVLLFTFVKIQREWNKEIEKIREILQIHDTVD